MRLAVGGVARVSIHAPYIGSDVMVEGEAIKSYEFQSTLPT